MKNIAVIGSGTWGTALGNTLVKVGHKVTIFSFFEDEINNLEKTHIHPNLKGVTLSNDLLFTSSISKACDNQDYLIMAVPSKFMRTTCEKLHDYIKENQKIICVSKGIENETLFTLTQVIEDVLKDKGVIALALSGPSHAEEVALDTPTTIVCAHENTDLCKEVQELFKNTCIRVYINQDIYGVEISGAIKNVIALACGIANGLGYGDNTKAALITRGIAETKRLGVALGANENTFLGLSGIGDLIVTATSIHSRNNKFGNLIGQGLEKEKALEEVGMVVEGLSAIEPTLKLAQKHNIEMPICNCVNEIINKKLDPAESVKLLMNRAFKDETN